MAAGPYSPKAVGQAPGQVGEVPETAWIVRSARQGRSRGRKRSSLAASWPTSYDYGDVREHFEQPDPSWARRAKGGLAALLLVPLTACSVAAEADALAEEHLVVHALVQVRRTETLGGEPRADALAGLIRVPDTADAAEVFALAGLREQLPAVGQCQAGDPAVTQLAETDIGVASVELVPADTVIIVTPGGEHPLAPHAFPSISDSIRGVIYTSRDQTAWSLPDAGKYEIVLRGAEGLEQGNAAYQSPGVPSSVTIGGVPLAEVDELSQADLDLTWAPSGSSLDLLAVRLHLADSTYTCTFRDADGFGSMSLLDARRALAPSLARVGDPTLGRAQGALSLHRIRAEASAAPGDASVVEVRFDFSVARELAFSSDALSGLGPGPE